MSFDYGCDEAAISRPVSNIKLWPTDGERTALVDADSIAYIIGYTSDLQQYLKAKRSPNFFESSIFLDKCDHANFVLNKWINAAGCDSAKLYLTDGANNFRIAIAKTKPYKGQRLEDKPPFFYEMRDWMMDFHGAIMSQNCEADDEVSIEAWKRIMAFDSEPWTSGHRKFSNFVVISGDKDLGIIPTWRCPPNTGVLEWIEPLGYLNPIWKEKDITNYEYWPLFKGVAKDLSLCSAMLKYQGKIQKRDKDQLECPKLKWEMDHVWFYQGKMQDIFTRGLKKNKGKFKRVKVGLKKSEYMDKLKGVGLKFFYSQLITGDSVDNYPGLPGCGNTKAYEVLDDATTEQELVSRVRQMYFNHYGEAADKMMLEQGQLAWMQTRRDELWTVPSSNEQSFPR